MNRDGGNKFKDSRGVFRTSSLFVESIQDSVAKSYKPMYSLRDYDYKGYPSAYNIYMTSIDEYEAALKIVGSMRHWRKLCALKWFRKGDALMQFDGIEQWRQDMADRDSSDAKKAIVIEVAKGNVAAAKALLAMGISKGAVKKKPPLTKKDTQVSEIDKVIGNVVSLERKGDGDE